MDITDIYGTSNNLIYQWSLDDNGFPEGNTENANTVLVELNSLAQQSLANDPRPVPDSVTLFQEGTRMDITDIYGTSNNLIYQWSLDDNGFPVCVNDGVLVTSNAAISVLQKNAGVRVLVQAVEEYELAISTGANTSTNTVTIAHANWRQGNTENANTVLVELNSLAQQSLANDPRPVPDSVTLFQGRTIMRNIPNPGGAGTLFDVVDAYIESNKNNNHALYDAWNYSNGFERNGALVSSLAPAFGISNTQLDQIFRQASVIRG